MVPYVNEKLINETKLLLVEFPNFLPAYILQGLIADNDRHMSGYADIYYQHALVLIKNAISVDASACISDMYDYVTYYIGLFYENVRGNKNMAQRYYQMIKHPDYRALYKISLMAEQLGNYQKARISYEYAISILEKETSRMIPFIESVYLFEMYYRLARLCRVHLKQYYVGLDFANRAIKFFYDKQYETFLYMFYQDNINKEISSAQKFFNISDLLQEKQFLETEIRYFEMM